MKGRYVIALSLLLLLGMPAPAAAEAAPLWTHTIGGTGVSAVAVSGDGLTVCAAGEDGLICLSPEGMVQWSSPLRMFDVALPDDGSVIVAGGFDIQIFAANGTRTGGRKTFNAIRSIAVDPEGTAYIASTDGSTIVEGPVRQDTATETEAEEDYFAVSLVPGTDYIAAGTETGSVLLTSAGMGTVFWEYRASAKPVNDIAVSDGARTIVACTGDGMVFALSRAGLLLWSVPFDRPAGVAVSRDGERIAVCGAEGFALFDRSGAKLDSIPVKAACTGIAVDREATLAAVSTDHDVSLYSLGAGDAAGAAGVTAPPTVSVAGGDTPSQSSPSPLTEDEPETAAAPTPTQAAPAPLGAVAGLLFALASSGRKK